MTNFRRLAYTTLVLTFLQIVFGAIVRITGSGLGCGDHWPDCYGSFTPVHRGIALLIEISHRYGAAVIAIAIAMMVIVTVIKRKEPGFRGRGGVHRPTVLAALLVLAAALLGAATVKLGLNPAMIVMHQAIAISLVAVLVVTVLRAGGLGARSDMTGGSTRTYRAALLAIALAALTVLFGALTANLPDAAASCGGFPWCRWVQTGGMPLAIQIIHRLIAFVLFGHLFGMAVAVAKRHEPKMVVRVARTAFGVATLQILIAAAMVEMHLPMVARSLHQAAGTLVWLTVCVLAGLAHLASEARTTADAISAAP
jgi:heme a synthase